jgi:hypothetical protein
MVVTGFMQGGPMIKRVLPVAVVTFAVWIALMIKRVLPVAVVAFAVWISFMMASGLGARAETPVLTWTIQVCDTLDEVTEFLNKLPLERALEAKIVTINSTRSFMGVWSAPYRVYYRR